jgi:hypothetical protein
MSTMIEAEKGYRTSKESSRQSARGEDELMPDTIPNHNAEAAAQIAAMSPEEFAAAEKALLWKIDTRLVPWMT